MIFRIFKIGCLFLFVLNLLNPSYGQCTSLDSISHTLIAQGIHQVHMECFDEAIDTFEKQIDLHPQNPLGYLGAALVY